MLASLCFMSFDLSRLSREELEAHLRQGLAQKRLWKVVYDSWCLDNTSELQSSICSRFCRSAYKAHGEDFVRQLQEASAGSSLIHQTWANSILDEARRVGHLPQ